MRKTVIYITIVIFGFILLNGCYYDEPFAEEDQPIGDVTFSGDIVPILDQSCNFGGCHAPGGPPPDLSAGVAYNNLINEGYVSKDSPESSELFLRMSGIGGVMPPQGKIAQRNIDIILAWIEQGALNN